MRLMYSLTERAPGAFKRKSQLGILAFRRSRFIATLWRFVTLTQASLKPDRQGDPLAWT